jgi:hypothetical protein
MKTRILMILMLLSLMTGRAHAQAWSGILNPVSGTGAVLTSPQKNGIDWSKAGVPGGIPSGSWTQAGATVAAGASTSTIQAALNACGTNHYVLLGPGMFSGITSLHVPSNCELRGSGTLLPGGTVISTSGSGAVYNLGGGGPNFNSPAAQTITGGATAGSTSITVGSASGISVGSLLAVSELNDPTYVTNNSANGTCTWCDGVGDNAIRTRGQIVLVTAVSGTTITISPGLYTNYGTASGTGPALVYYFSPGGQYSGVSNLQTYQNGTGYSQVFNMTACEYCWVKGVFDNYADGDHADVLWGYRDEFRDSYFSNAYTHAPGTIDSDIFLISKTTATLVENNIFERLHVGVMLGWGTSGNVVAYNYDIGNFDASATIVNFAAIDFHGAHPQFNLFEGNIGNQITMDAFWGSSSNNTIFRNQWRGTDTLASPRASGRNVVNWSSTVLASQQVMGEQLAFPHTNINSIGNVNGSADAITIATAGKYNSGASPFTSTIEPSASRPYDNFFSAISVGYNTGSDLSGSSVASFNGGYWVGKGATTFFQHGNFDIASNTIMWDGSTTHTLPPSFYLTARPSWFGTIPWPPIGPDVTGGNVDAAVLQGHVYANPAKACYDATSRDSAGIKLFDPNVCYVAGTPPPPPPPTPAPTNLYGTGVQATALNNINVGGPSNKKVAYRFTASYTGTITGGIYYHISSSTPGYSGGTLGTIVPTIATDSSNTPGSTIATCSVGTGFFPVFTCSAAVVAGQTYYVVFTNTDPSPTVNFASVDGLYNVGAVQDPNFPYTSLESDNGGAWLTDLDTQPILQLNYSNGHAQGNGYMEVWINTSSVALSSTTWARELFTPTSTNTFALLRIGPGVVAGTTFTIALANGTVIESGILPAPASTGWSTYKLSAFRTFVAGTQYQLILKTAGTAYPIRKGSTQGFTSETYFPDGHAQFSTNSGSTWTDFNDESLNPSTLGDLEFTFQTDPFWSGIVDHTRATTWNNTVGIANGVPIRTTVCATLTASATGAQISAAIAACPAGQVVSLGAGTYTISGGITFGARNNVTLRGAGPTQTKLNFTSGQTCGTQTSDICLANSTGLSETSPSTQPGGSNSANWIAGYSQNGTQITLDAVPAGLSVGNTIVLDQQNDASDTGGIFESDSLTNSLSGGSLGRTISGIKASQQQIVTVTGINGTVLTITPGLYMNNWRSSQHPGIWWTGPQLLGAGLENLTLNHNGSGTTVQSGVLMFNCSNCYIKGVVDLNSNRNHVWMYLTSNSVVRDSYFYGSQNAAATSYGVEFGQASANLIENNIFQTTVTSVMPANAQGNVVSYNFDINDSYNTPSTLLQTSYVSHAAGTGMNLFESNVTQGLFCDDIHGTSNVNTLFRNRLLGLQLGKTQQTDPILFSSYCRANNVVGNVLGTTGFHTTYEASTTTGTTGCWVSIYNLGFGNQNCASGVPANDAITTTSLFRWGNYDTVTGTARWVTGEVPTVGIPFVNGNLVPVSTDLPNSFYLSAKPAFWGAEPYPAIGPDVTGGSGPGGFSYTTPAQNCWLTRNTALGQPANGTGTALTNFDATLCYTSVPSTLAISTTSLSNATQNTGYNATLVAVNGLVPYTWSITVGSLPAGLTLAPTTGLISGTPTTIGTSNFTVSVTDAGSSIVTQALSITVVAVPAVTITTIALPNGIQNAAYTTTVAATGGVTPYTWSITFGTLPAGLTLAPSSGIISGTPTTGGINNFTVGVHDANGATATHAYTITITPLTITTVSLPGAIQNSVYNTTVAASGGTTPYVWSLSVGPITPGLSLNSNGQISGTPTTVGTTTFTIRVTDANGTIVDKVFSITVATSTGSGITLVQAISVQGSGLTSLSEPYTSPNTAGNLLIVFVRMSTSTQTVGITDTLGNTYTQAVAQIQTNDLSQIHIFYVANCLGGTNTVKATFSGVNNHPWLVVYEYSGLSATSPLDRVSGAQGFSTTPNSGTTASTTHAPELVFGGFGFPATYTGTQAVGASFSLIEQDQSTSPAANETLITPVTGTFAATYNLGTAANWSAVIATFSTTGIAVINPSLPNASANVPYSQTLTAAGGTPPYTWAVTVGTLPAGLSLNTSTGVISGTPTVLGTSSFTVQATDIHSATGSKALSILVTTLPVEPKNLGFLP